MNEHVLTSHNDKHRIIMKHLYIQSHENIYLCKKASRVSSRTVYIYETSSTV